MWTDKQKQRNSYKDPLKEREILFEMVDKLTALRNCEQHVHVAETPLRACEYLHYSKYHLSLNQNILGELDIISVILGTERKIFPYLKRKIISIFPTSDKGSSFSNGDNNYSPNSGMLE